MSESAGASDRVKRLQARSGAVALRRRHGRAHHWDRTRQEPAPTGHRRTPLDAHGPAGRAVLVAAHALPRGERGAATACAACGPAGAGVVAGPAVLRRARRRHARARTEGRRRGGTHRATPAAHQRRSHDVVAGAAVAVVGLNTDALQSAERRLTTLGPTPLAGPARLQRRPARAAVTRVALEVDTTPRALGEPHRTPGLPVDAHPVDGDGVVAAAAVTGVALEVDDAGLAASRALSAGALPAAQALATNAIEGAACSGFAAVQSLALGRAEGCVAARAAGTILVVNASVAREAARRSGPSIAGVGPTVPAAPTAPGRLRRTSTDCQHQAPHRRHPSQFHGFLLCAARRDSLKFKATFQSPIIDRHGPQTGLTTTPSEPRVRMGLGNP